MKNLITKLALTASTTLALAADYTMQEYNDTINLQITEINWSAWRAIKGLSELPDIKEKVEVIAVKKGEIIKRDIFGGGVYMLFTIEDIENDFVVVHFNNEAVVEYNGKGISMLSEKHEWTVNIKYNEEYGLASQTFDQGAIWKLTFIK